MKNILFIIFVGVLATSCEKKEEKLPILGERVTVEEEVNGKTVVDTVYHRIPAFTFVNQENKQVTEKTVKDKIYIADFFFTTCPTICPKMKSQLLRIYEKYKNNDQVLILSHSVDVEHDSVEVLKAYADNLEVSADTWHFMTGEEEDIYKMAGHYLLAAQKDSTALGGYDHSGKFVLVDKDRHIRATCNGTDAKEVDKFIKKIELLLAEYKIAASPEKG
ncbi:MAG: SCO family protein [Thermonemataceae bacterium]